ncbi:MAG: helix-turn-helix domain-containing protein [Candidatus Eisenbacteria bacterium]|nr:helix-turn-helix domain-containing protein [Candidatus Eisenbacteria bacterium]MCC7141054.1 helix-turn-helix domain-containing protein [Candidatus Eisenbacteria bacterium]
MAIGREATTDSKDTNAGRDFQVLSRPGELRALAQEERLRILHLLGGEAMTGAQVGERLGIPANRAHYHLGQLLRHGLVRETGRGRKRWKEERIFQATARHFVVDPALGGARSETTDAMLRSAELAFLRWRRDEVLQFDLASFARNLVHDCLRVGTGERVLLMFSAPALELAEALQVELEAVQARPLVKMWSRNTIIRTLERHSVEELAAMPFLPELDDQALDAGIYLSTTIPQGGPPGPDLLPKLPHLMESVSRWHRSMRQRGLRYIEVSLPHLSGFAGGDLSPEQCIDVYWRSLGVDYPELRARLDRLRAKVGSESRFSLQDGRGGSLAFDIDPKSAYLSDGIICPDDLAAGRCFDELPAGALGYLPAGRAAEGRISVESAYIGRGHVRDLELEIHQGVLTDWKAGQGADDLRHRLESALGDWNVVSELRVGANLQAAGLTGVPALDCCLSGVVTLGLGNNELLGGDVRSTFGLALPMARATLRAGDHLLVENGRLVD